MPIGFVSSDDVVSRTKIYTHCNYHIMYVFIENKNRLLRTKIYGIKTLNNSMLYRNNKLVWTRVNGHILDLDTECNECLCCGRKKKMVIPNILFVYSATAKIHALLK